MAKLAVMPVPFAEPEPDMLTKEGWRAFVNAEAPEPPPLLTRPEYDRLTKDAQRRYNEQRIRHHSAFGPIQTSKMLEAHAAMTAMLTANVAAELPRPGLVLDACGGYGKSTILRWLGLLWEKEQRAAHERHFGDTPTDDFVPVVLVTLGSEMTCKELNAAILHFYGAPIAHKSSDTMARTIREVARRCSTLLFLIDDIHFLKMRYQRARQVNDHLKYLASTISGTFMYAGVDVLSSGLFAERNEVTAHANPGLTQTQWRFTRLELELFEHRPNVRTDAWRMLLCGIEREPRLLDAPDNVLSGRLASYLHQRTGGHIGSLSQLVRIGAYRAMATDEENLTEELLDGININYGAELQARLKGQRHERPKRARREATAA